MHKTRLPELTHACIDDGVVRHPSCRFEVLLTIIPREARKLILKRPIGHSIKKVNQLANKTRQPISARNLSIADHSGRIARCWAEVETRRGEIS